MPKINQKQNGIGVTLGSGRSYPCLGERIERGSEKGKKEKLSIFPKFGLFFHDAAGAFFTWTVADTLGRAACVLGEAYSVSPRICLG